MCDGLRWPEALRNARTRHMNESKGAMVATSFNPAHHARVNLSHPLRSLPIVG
jgi:hypothetical protein